MYCSNIVVHALTGANALTKLFTLWPHSFLALTVIVLAWFSCSDSYYYLCNAAVTSRCEYMSSEAYVYSSRAEVKYDSWMLTNLNICLFIKATKKKTKHKQTLTLWHVLSLCSLIQNIHKCCSLLNDKKIVKCKN